MFRQNGKQLKTNFPSDQTAGYGPKIDDRACARFVYTFLGRLF